MRSSVQIRPGALGAVVQPGLERYSDKVEVGSSNLPSPTFYYKMKILFICRANLQRSPTAVDVFNKLAKRFNIKAEAKSAGIDELSEVVINKALINWADRIYVMEQFQKEFILSLEPLAKNKIKVLNIKDVYYRDDPELITILENKLKNEFKLV